MDTEIIIRDKSEHQSVRIFHDCGGSNGDKMIWLTNNDDEGMEISESKFCQLLLKFIKDRL